MRIEFENGWWLHTHDQPHILGGGAIWFSVTHTHTASKGGTWQDTTTMLHGKLNKCSNCGSVPPDALDGYVNLVKWSMNDADA